MADLSGKKVLVTEPIHPSGVEVLKQAGCEIVFADSTSPERLAELAKDASGIVVRLGKLPRSVIESAPMLKVIGRHGVGFDNIDVQAATECGVVVANCPGSNSQAVAEHAVALMLAAGRKIPQHGKALKTGEFLPDVGKQTMGRMVETHNLVGTELAGKTLGLIGIGNIGSKVAKICVAGFDMRVLAYDPYVKSTTLPGVTLVEDIETILEQADFISLHLPLLESTRGIIGAAELRRMKPAAYIVNTSRGGLIDEVALAGALKEGVIAGAGIDVFEAEPAPPDHPLLAQETCIPTAHAGGISWEALANMSTGAAEAVVAVLSGQRPRSVVNPDVLERAGV